MKTLGIIPSRYGSTRFPGKPLINIGGKSMIQRVYEQVKKSELLTEVVVATDDDRIFKHVKSFGGNVVMTSSEHINGTLRCNEVVKKTTGSFDVVVNIQGDEPFINPAQIDQLCACFNDANAQIATLVKKITDTEELLNPNRPKVEIDAANFAKMFSRKPIPVIDGLDEREWLANKTYFKHIGIYGYRKTVLTEICQLSPSPLEIEERLEQLRWLENGYSIKVAETTHEAIAIDTPEDLKKISF